MVRRKPKSRLLLASRLFIGAAALVLLIGVSIAWTQHQDNHNPSAQSASAGGTSTEPAPSTEKPKESAFQNHHVAPDAPRYISIAKISVKAMVKPVGVTAANQIESPRNVFDAGWYNKSAKPGQPGAMVFDGHVSSWDTNGVFYELKKLEAGDEIKIERGDGTVFSYKVTRSQIYEADKVDMAAALTPVNPDKPGLNLITCTGTVIKGTNEFDKRLVVFAEQL